jgi:uncharacterized protein (DUF427 family)
MSGHSEIRNGYVENPDYDVHFEPCQKRLRVEFNGEAIVDTWRAQYLMESNRPPIYYVPRQDVRMELLTPTGHHTVCPYKGLASYWTIAVGARTAENAVWAYDDPFPQVSEIAGYMAFYWDRVDRWYEDGEEIHTPSAPG